jgi:hypothetical protein
MYRKIDMHIGPTIAQTRLVQHHVCDCKMPVVNKEVREGTRYNVDLKSVRWVKFVCGGCGKESEIRVIDVWTPLLTPMWYPLECLEIDAAIPLAPKPEKWMPVKDNKVLPAHGVPGGIPV